PSPIAPSSAAGCGLRRVTEVAARCDVGTFLTSVVPLPDPRMSLVSMANSDGISKRPVLPISRGGLEGGCLDVRESTSEAGLPSHGVTVLVVVTHPPDASRRRPWRL